METYNWVGGSGVQYTYQISQIEDDIAAGQDGNYIFCKIYNGT